MASWPERASALLYRSARRAYSFRASCRNLTLLRPSVQTPESAQQNAQDLQQKAAQKGGQPLQLQPVFPLICTERCTEHHQKKTMTSSHCASAPVLAILHTTYACVDWDSQGEAFQLTPNRGCTDILFLLFWIVFWSGAVCGANSEIMISLAASASSRL